MKQSVQPNKILLEYLNTSSQETFKRKIELNYPQLNNLQFEILSEKLKQYVSFSKEYEVLLLFPYILNNIRFLNPELKQKRIVKLLWERGFENKLEKIERLEQMYESWMTLEQELNKIEKERFVNKEPEQERN
ncbi:MAG TPA: hypothetical protein PLL09_00960 [Flavobacterium sp.]|uniref:hypothetical protein n=1 Tax=unclassified Flavobacterium TaxID=196869 RepID=UPI000E7E9D83|nr:MULTISPECIES: hypothetical protein [unclassified Flavobacterium]HBI01415.1 hypothetical protein [Flavobacterium sp.]HRE76369.1 hypothetical protein [Flavobacterium sp.]